MPIFRVPKTIRWIIICGLTFLLLMSLYRLSVYSFFDYFELSDTEVFASFWAGFKFDARVVGGFSLLLLLLSFWPNLHFFKTDLGRNTALFLYFLFTGGLLLFYAADTISLFTFKSRLNGTLISDLVKSTPKGQRFMQGAPWIVIFLSIIVATWLLFLIIKFMHRLINKKSLSTDKRPVRIFWQIALVLLCLSGIYGRIGKQPLTSSLLSAKLSDTAVQLTLNPFEAFFSTLPKAS